MSIKTKVLIWCSTAIGVAILITGMHFIVTRNANLAIERRGIAIDIAQGSLELNILSDQYISSHNERALAQWEARYDSILALLEQLSKGDDDIGKAIISNIDSYMMGLKTAFAALGDVTGTDNQDVFYRERSALFSSEISVKSGLLASSAIKLSNHYAAHVQQSVGQASILITISLLILIIILGFFWVIISRQTQMLTNTVTDLAAINKELEAFSYSVSHDLRAPLRSIDGFSQALLEDYPDKLDKQGKNYLQRIRSSTQRMGILIDDLLKLSRITRSEMKDEMIDLSTMAHLIIAEFYKIEPERQVEFVIMPDLKARGDGHLMKLLLENLLENAFKYTSRHPQARIEFGSTQVEGKQTFFVRDDGAGFDMTYVDKLFKPFQRLHSDREFPGIGIGLATVQRIINRHSGQVWAEAEIEKGATFYFTLGKN